MNQCSTLSSLQPGGQSLSPLSVFPQPISDTWIKKVASSSSSLLVKYGTGPGLVPCFTQPESLSFNVLAGTLYVLAALLAPMAPDRTASIALSNDSLLHFLSVFGLLVSSWSTFLHLNQPFRAASAWFLFSIFEFHSSYK